MDVDIKKLLTELTLEEKAGMCSGADFWHTKAVRRLGIPSVMMSDGPHGLRKQVHQSDHLGLSKSVEAVCFPTGSAIGASFDRNLARQLGSHLGEAGRAEGLHTVLGPAINIKRSPLCGRNFEYFSEDPYLAGELAAAYVDGVQAKGVGACVKHFAANNQEYRRMRVDVLANERTLREIYLAAFETVVKKAAPWSLMCAYNRLNGTYCCENEWLLTKVLREEWGFDGIVVTDWSAMNRRVKALKAGLELEMPSSHGVNDALLVKAVQDGDLPEAALDKAVERLLFWIGRGLPAGSAADAYDKEAHHSFARRVACECAVLLKNENRTLPLVAGEKIAFIGAFADMPRFQGGGSSRVNNFKAVGALEAAGNIPNVVYEPGFSFTGEEADEAMMQRAVTAARQAQTAVVFAGLPDAFESEGFDRAHLDLPACQNELILRVCAAQPRTVVVLHGGSPIAMPWAKNAPAILLMHLGGQAVGEAAVDLLFGHANPSGKLAETYPLRLEDTPCYLNYPGDGFTSAYDEGVFVGYRWYDSRNMPVLFPYGHGLSYTKFYLSGLALSSQHIKDGGMVTVVAKVQNIGDCAGAEVVQLYVAPPDGPGTPQPAQQLRGFEKVFLQPGETRQISFELNWRSLSYFDVQTGGWRVKPGQHEIRLGHSSRDVPLRARVCANPPSPPFQLGDHTTLGDVLEAGDPGVLDGIVARLQEVFATSTSVAANKAKQAAMAAMVENLPLHSIVSYLEMTPTEINRLLDDIDDINKSAATAPCC